MNEFTARLRDQWSRLSAQRPTTQLTLGGILAVIVLLVAVVAWTTGGGEGGSPPATGSVSERAARLAQEPDATVGEDDLADSGPLAGRTTRSRGRVQASGEVGSAPAELAPVTETTVKIGITYTENPGGANAAAGFTVGQVDQRRGWEALIADINKDPAFGRKVVPVWYSQTEEELQSKGDERIGQEACAHFTQDNKVFMVWVGTIGGSDSLAACLTKARVPQINFGIGETYSKSFETFPYYVEPSSAAMDRMAAFYVDGLYDAGFFAKFKDNSPPYTPQKPADGKSRIGLIRYDQASHKAGAAAMRNRLAAHGLSVCDGCEFEIGYSGDNVPEQLDDATEINAAIQSCKSRNCTHMLFLGSTAQRIPIFFMDGAEKQQYRPRLALTPLDDPAFVEDFLGSSSHPQFRQSQQVTWTPRDLGDGAREFNRCKQIFANAGETFQGDEAAGKEAMIPTYCDSAWYYAAAMKATGETLDLASWMKGVESMAGLPSAGAYLMQTKSGRHDGISAIRIGDWAEGCTCYKAATPVRAV